MSTFLHQEQRLLGNITLIAQDEAFFDGYQEGYLFFKAHHHNQILAEGDLHAILARSYFKGDTTTRFNDGFITGWYAALFEPGRPDYPNLEAVICAVRTRRRKERAQ